MMYLVNILATLFIMAGENTSAITGINFSDNLINIIYSGPKINFQVSKKSDEEFSIMLERCTLKTDKEYSFNSGDVKSITARQEKDGVRIDVYMRTPFDYSVFEGDKIISIKLRSIALSKSKSIKIIPAKKPSLSSSSKSTDLIDNLPKYRVDVDYADTSIRTVIIQMLQRAGINVIFDSDVGGDITVSLRGVAFNEAFKTVLNMKGLVAQQIGDNVIRITTAKKIRDEQSSTLLQTKIFFLNYVKASDLKTQIESISQAEGRTTSKCNVDETNNALIVTDTPYGLDVVEKLVKDLDRMPKQVLIEAKLVEVSLDSGLYTGVQWGVERRNETTQIGMGNTENVVKDLQGNPLYALPFYGLGSGTGVSLTPEQIYGSFRFLKVTSKTLLDATISAAVKKGKANVLSNPKIATLNNTQATINITNQIPYVTTEITNTSGGSVSSTKVTYITAGIVLKVLPTITADGKIVMKISPKVSKPSQTAQFQPPSIDERTADTTVVVEDGDTIAIGGLIHDSESEYVYKVPLFGDIPIIGYLFKKKTKERNRMELIIFVTPKII
ncbi:MAG: secretin N-terminal domain-containing protein [Elusimicrobiales bacterium]